MFEGPHVKGCHLSPTQVRLYERTTLPDVLQSLLRNLPYASLEVETESMKSSEDCVFKSNNFDESITYFARCFASGSREILLYF